MGTGKRRRACAGQSLRQEDVLCAASAISMLAQHRMQQQQTRRAAGTASTVEQAVVCYMSRGTGRHSVKSLHDLHSLEVHFKRDAIERSVTRSFIEACTSPSTVAADFQRIVGALVCSLYKTTHAACALTGTALPAHSFSQFAVGLIYSCARGYELSTRTGQPAHACRLPPAACRLPPAACRLPTADCRLPPADCRLPTACAGIQLNNIQLVPACPMLADALPLARLQNAVGQRTTGEGDRLFLYLLRHTSPCLHPPTTHPSSQTQM